jgi:two-component system, cell cycle sensor histidine kinase and response regulator CckA
MESIMISPPEPRKMQALEQLAGGIAHDLNNLLTAMGGNLEFVLEQIPMDDPLLEPLSDMKMAVARTRALTHDLLAFSGTQRLVPVALDLNAAVASLEGALRLLLGDSIGLELRLADSVPPILADPAALEQVVVRLAENARDAMSHGGTLWIETARVDLGAGASGDDGAGPGDEHVRLTLRDTGSGIPPEIHHRLFEPFFTTKPRGHGKGLGLACVHGAVRQSAGQVEVDSEAGRGTTVRLTFPAAR